MLHDLFDVLRHVLALSSMRPFKLFKLCDISRGLEVKPPLSGLEAMHEVSLEKSLLCLLEVIQNRLFFLLDNTQIKFVFLWRQHPLCYSILE